MFHSYSVGVNQLRYEANMLALRGCAFLSIHYFLYIQVRSAVADKPPQAAMPSFTQGEGWERTK